MESVFTKLKNKVISMFTPVKKEDGEIKVLKKDLDIAPFDLMLFNDRGEQITSLSKGIEILKARVELQKIGLAKRQEVINQLNLRLWQNNLKLTHTAEELNAYKNLRFLGRLVFLFTNKI